MHPLNIDGRLSYLHWIHGVRSGCLLKRQDSHAGIKGDNNYHPHHVLCAYNLLGTV